MFSDLFNSDDSEESDSQKKIHRSDLDPTAGGLYDDLFDDVMGQAKDVNVEAKPSIRGVQVLDSEDHTHSDLVEMQEEFDRIQEEFIDMYGKELAYTEMMKCVYAKHTISILTEMLEVSENGA